MIRAARVGEQTAPFAYASVRRTPSRASRSRFGVFDILPAITAEVAVPHVIHHDQDDVGFVSGLVDALSGQSTRLTHAPRIRIATVTDASLMGILLSLG